MACSIYGQEVVRYTYNLTDTDNAVLDNTLDWIIEDTNLDTSDNSDIHTDTSIVGTQTKSYQSVGTKHVHTEVDFDDGWGNIYQHETDLDVTAMVYEPPVLDIAWTPEAPTIVDEVTFTQNHDDIRDISISKQYGLIDTVDVDLYKDGTDEEIDILKTDTWTYTFTTKEDGIDIHVKATYWDGWEYQVTDITRTMDMSNVPPVSEWDREDNGQCIPAYVWNATSTDIDDDDTTLIYNWTLYVNDGAGGWNVLDTSTDSVYTYPFQYENDYKITLKTTDIEGDFTIKEEEFPIVFSTCDSSGSGGGSAGIIRLESSRFEMVACPVPGMTVHEYFLAKVEAVTGKAASESIEFVKAYPSNDISSGKYLGFVPGVTNPDSSYNFKLVDTDNGVDAHVPFFVKTKELAEPIIIEWDSAEGVTV